MSGTNVYTTGVVSGGTTGATTFTGLQTLVTAKMGWYMNLTASTTAVSEKALNKPTVFGGLVMFTSFIPSSDVCGLGGNSYVYAVYYKTGTAYTTSAIGSSGTLVYNRTQTASTGMASSIAIHSGRESGAQAFVQMSTGETTSLTTTPTSSIKSAVISWREL
jgi:type IV pilus assembly protein PilY1